MLEQRDRKLLEKQIELDKGREELEKLNLERIAALLASAYALPYAVTWRIQHPRGPDNRSRPVSSATGPSAPPPPPGLLRVGAVRAIWGLRIQ